MKWLFTIPELLFLYLTTELGQGIPVVLIVLEGGLDALRNTKNAVCRGIPTVVCEGTGRAADIIAYAHNHAIVVE